jgi:hypothetical protein
VKKDFNFSYLCTMKEKTLEFLRKIYSDDRIDDKRRFRAYDLTSEIKYRMVQPTVKDR